MHIEGLVSAFIDHLLKVSVFPKFHNHMLLYPIDACKINEDRVLLPLLFLLSILSDFVIIHFLENYRLVY